MISFPIYAKKTANSQCKIAKNVKIQKMRHPVLNHICDTI